MSEMSLEEAQLFRILGSFFGRDRVVWNMSVRAVCGGGLSEGAGYSSEDLSKWSDVAGCLFTIVDGEDNPKMVVEFAVDLRGVIDLKLLERQTQLPSVLHALGIKYIAVTPSEFEDLLKPDSSINLMSLLEERLGLSIDED
jgi:hypothetical protein